MKKKLKKYFGYDNFRPMQEEIVSHVVNRQNSLVLMPTGGGKSLCYQLPALFFDGLTIVVSPLISLMKDQVDSLTANGISSAFINSSLSFGEIQHIKNLISDSKIKLLYIAPERFGVPDFKSFLDNLRISLIAIDEAHCVSEWGHDFRPHYRKLKDFISCYKGTPVIALTATATDRVRHDIIKQLDLLNPRIFVSGFDRPNLHYHIIPKKNTFRLLLTLLKKYIDESIIIYVFSRKDSEKLSSDLNDSGFNAVSYHAGLNPEMRNDRQEKFITDKVSIIVATIAFGMGIDKPDIRLIVHYGLPKTIEGYYQETGRAGRDGLKSECVLYYSYGDKFKHDFFIDKIEDNEESQKAKRKLRQVIDFCELDTCRRTYLLEYFGEKTDKKNCMTCDICQSEREEFEATIITQKVLSCVIRTGNRFGLAYIIDVLRGSDSKKIKGYGHNELSVFGIVDDYSPDELRQIISSIVNVGFLYKEKEGYPILKLTNEGASFLKNRDTILLSKPKLKVIKEKRGTKKIKESGDYDMALFAKLRTLRKEIAAKKGVPPFVIFSDVSLQQMCRSYPVDSESFLEISGVGSLKLSVYGEMFTNLIQRHITTR